jgi:2'-hydroxyisoflavone reductase
MPASPRMFCCQWCGDVTMAEATPKALRLLILGGTTFLGVHMTELALRRGHSVTLFNRGQSHPERFPGIERLRGDRDGQLDALKARQWDAVLDNSGYVPRHVRESAELLAPNVRQYLFISTISVYANLGQVNDERSPVAVVEDESREDWRNAYGALKALCERAVAASLPGRTTIVRPGLIVGPDDPTDRFTYWPVRAIRGGEILAPGDPQASFQLIDVRDLATFCLDAVTLGLDGVFNVTSPPASFTMGAVIQTSIAAAQALAKPHIPARATWVSGQFLCEQGVQPFVGLPGWVPDGGELRRLHETRVDRALNAGLKVTPLEATARDTLAWHLARPHPQRMTLRAGITVERECELLTLWHAKTRPSA